MDLIVETKLGKIKGLLRTSQVGDEYCSFQGIPFAKPPLGELRFRDPVPVDPWSDVLDATAEKSVPHAKKNHFPEPPENEDCLYLNVYSRDLRSSKKPVIVFIYGGGFHSGSGSTRLYGPDFLMQKSLVLVTFNYRLGVFGFISFKDPALGIPGNAALKDQRQVLRWVRDNIEAFGGDPDNVTLVGHSAGAASVHHHMLAPSSAGLFRRAIILSGSALAMWGLSDIENMPQRLAKSLGWDGNGDEKGVYEFLLSQDGAKIMKATHESRILRREDTLRDHFHSFGPRVEPYETPDSFILKPVKELLKDPWSKDIEAIVWIASNEALMLDPQTDEALKNGVDDETLVPFEVKRNLSPQELKEAIRKVRAMYGDFKDFRKDNIQPYVDFRNDQVFLHSIHRLLLSRVTYCPGKTYFAYFDLVSDTLNHTKIRHNAANEKGASHADELSYVFTNSFGPVPPKESLEFSNIQKMVDLFYGFMKDGQGYCDGISWKPVPKTDLPYNYKALVIRDPEWSFGVVEEMERYKIWDSLFPPKTLF